jgi:hypothetical protein
MLQVVASLTIVILMTRGVIYAPDVVNYAPKVITLMEKMYSTGSRAIVKIFLKYRPQERPL